MDPNQIMKIMHNKVTVGFYSDEKKVQKTQTQTFRVRRWIGRRLRLKIWAHVTQIEGVLEQILQRQEDQQEIKRRANHRPFQAQSPLHRQSLRLAARNVSLGPCQAWLLQAKDLNLVTVRIRRVHRRRRTRPIRKTRSGLNCLKSRVPPQSPRRSSHFKLTLNLLLPDAKRKTIPQGQKLQEVVHPHEKTVPWVCDV